MAELLESNSVNLILFYVSVVLTFICKTVELFVLLCVPRRLLYRRKDIRGQRVLITGAGSGVGRHLAVEFSKHRVCLVLADIDRQSLLQTERLLDRRSTVFLYDCDVSDYKKVYEMAEKVRKDTGGDVDILVNNAGIVCGNYLTDLTEDKIIKTMEVNALAHFWTVKAFLPAMMSRNRGHVVSIASMLGKVPCPKLTDYCASKFAAVGFAECLEIELRERRLDGIKVTIVCPSLIDTGLFDGFRAKIGAALTPEYVAKEVVLGVLEEQETIYLPHFMKHLNIFGLLWPRWLGIKLSEAHGAIKAMENFTGRRRMKKTE